MSARDVITIFVAFVFAIALGLFLIQFMSDTTSDKLVMAESFNESTEAVDSINAFKQNVTSKFDYLFFMVFMGLIISLLIVSWVFAGEPIFTFLYVIVMMFSLVLSPIFSNVFTTVTENANFGTLINSYPITTHIMNNLPIYVVVVGLLGFLVMYGKPRVLE